MNEWKAKEAEIDGGRGRESICYNRARIQLLSLVVCINESTAEYFSEHSRQVDGVGTRSLLALALRKTFGVADCFGEEWKPNLASLAEELDQLAGWDRREFHRGTEDLALPQEKEEEEVVEWPCHYPDLSQVMGTDGVSQNAKAKKEAERTWAHC